MSASLTVGPGGAVGRRRHRGARRRGSRTAAICLPSVGELEAARRASPAPASSSPGATCPSRRRPSRCASRPRRGRRRRSLLPSGDHVAFETRAPAGTWIGFFEPSVAEISWMPTLLRIVSARARFALKSMKTPPSSWNGFEKVFISDRTVADLVEEPFLVGAGVGQRDVQVARREHRVGELGGRRGVALLLEDVVRPRGALLGRGLGEQRQLAQRKDCCGQQPREPFRHATSVTQRLCLRRSSSNCEAWVVRTFETLERPKQYRTQGPRANDWTVPAV